MKLEVTVQPKGDEWRLSQSWSIVVSFVHTAVQCPSTSGSSKI